MCDIKAMEAVVLVSHFSAVLVTAFRLIHRYRMRRLWWDDYCAAVALINDIFLAIAFSLKSTDLAVAKTWYWVMIPTCPLVIWFARLSIGLSIMRFCSSTTWTRWALHMLHVSFIAMFLVTLIQRIQVCALKSSWILSPKIVVCSMGRNAGIIAIITDVVADSILVGIPLYMLWRVKLPRTQRYLILSVFAASFISSIPAVAYIAILQSLSKAIRFKSVCSVVLVIHLKTATTLMVCNLLVVVTYLYRILWKEDVENDYDSSRTHSEDDDDDNDEQRRQKRSAAGSGPGKYTDLGFVSTAKQSQSSLFPHHLTGYTSSSLSQFTSTTTSASVVGNSCYSQSNPTGTTGLSSHRSTSTSDLKLSDVSRQ